MSIRNEGSITFLLKHSNQNWYKDNNIYKFNNLPSLSGIELKVEKRPPNKLHLEITGIHEKKYTLYENIPVCDNRELFVAITWKGDWLKLYFNGNLITYIENI